MRRDARGGDQVGAGNAREPAAALSRGLARASRLEPTTEMRECIGCKTTMVINKFEKNKKGILCMHSKKNGQDRTKIIRKM